MKFVPGDLILGPEIFNGKVDNWALLLVLWEIDDLHLCYEFGHYSSPGLKEPVKECIRNWNLSYRNWTKIGSFDSINSNVKSILMEIKNIEYPRYIENLGLLERLMTFKKLTQTAPYGYCPWCKTVGISRERTIDGNDICEKGHVYPSSAALEEI